MGPDLNIQFAQKIAVFKDDVADALDQSKMNHFSQLQNHDQIGHLMLSHFKRSSHPPKGDEIPSLS